MMNTLESKRYSIVKRNGDLHSEKRHISKEEAEKALALSEKRGWGWTVKRHSDEDMKLFVALNAWYFGAL